MSVSRIRLVHIITGLSTGGAEMMLFKLIQHIDRTRYEPYVISLTTQGDLGRYIESLDVPVEALGMRRGRFQLLKFLKLMFLLRSLHPDIVQTWMYHSDLLGGIAARLVGIRTVSWAIRQSNISPKVNKRSSLYVMKICSILSHWIPNKIISCSEKARITHVETGYDEEKIVVIANGFDLNKFIPSLESRISVRNELGIPDNTPLVGLIARYDPQKNHEGFLEAARLINKQLPEVRFLLVGSGVDKSNSVLSQKIQKAGVEDVVHLLGRRDDIPRLMASLDVLASSSSGEGFSNVLGEAMACGIICVVTDVGDSADIVGNTGRVVSLEDMASLAKEILYVLSLSRNERQDLSNNSRRRIVNNYEIGTIVEKYEQYFEKLILKSRFI
jgi:glycosyltransferase involved in cell wall biosynthesis